MNAYKMNFATMTLTITKAFEEACANPSSNEYKRLTRFQKDFPDLKIERRTHKTPTKYRNADKSTTSRNQFKNLTYKHMEQFMNALPDSQQKEEVLKIYHYLRDAVGPFQTNAYKTVREWFVKQFPHYRKNPLFYIKNDFKVIDITPILNADKEPKTGDEERKNA